MIGILLILLIYNNDKYFPLLSFNLLWNEYIVLA